MKKVLFICTLINLIVGVVNCKSQPDSNLHSVENSLTEYNLKGSVKEIVTKLERFYPDTTDLGKIIEYELKNFWSVNGVPLGRHSYNIQGFVEDFQYRYLDTLPSLPLYETWNKIYSYKYDLDNLNKKLEQFGENADFYPFPTMNPYRILVNHTIQSYNEARELSGQGIERLYEYECDNTGKVLSQVERDEKRINVRKIYSYDFHGRITKQELLFMEELPDAKRLFLDVRLEPSYIIPSINQKGHYEFEYTEEGNVKMVRLILDGNIIFQEEYNYTKDSLRPFKLERYVVSAITSRNQFSDYSTEWFNEFGDITKAENYDNDKNLIRTQYYDYEYDEHNNWIECRMYLEGQPERTEKPTIVAHRSIEYYEE